MRKEKQEGEFLKVFVVGLLQKPHRCNGFPLWRVPVWVYKPSAEEKHWISASVTSHTNTVNPSCFLWWNNRLSFVPETFLQTHLVLPPQLLSSNPVTASLLRFQTSSLSNTKGYRSHCLDKQIHLYRQLSSSDIQKTTGTRDRKSPNNREKI